MNRSQKYISILLERLPKWELRSYENQTTLDRIRDRVSSAPDLETELQTLYQVRGFSEFAVSLMWIADKVEKDPVLEESTLSEETFVFAKLRHALGDISSSEQETVPATTETDFTSSPGIEPEIVDSAPPVEQGPTPGQMLDSIWGVPSGSPTPAPSVEAGSTSGNEQERSFASLMERFLESVQGGSEDRTKLMSDLLNECNTVISDSSVAEDFKNFCQLLVEFLRYISDNQYLDDVRVMNIVSNIQDPVTQWANSEQSNQAGLLDPAIEILRDYKTMFE